MGSAYAVSYGGNLEELERMRNEMWAKLAVDLETRIAQAKDVTPKAEGKKRRVRGASSEKEE